ncbi:MAG: hypothetical protein J0L99_20635 [Chitinophagales bacterium]|nr:hypothetical protein [Chitinophagales bacterium]
MKYSLLFLLLFGLGFLSQAIAQSTTDLENKLKKAANKTEQLNLRVQLAYKYFEANNVTKAYDHASAASRLAVETGDRRKEAEATYLSGEAAFRRKDYKGAGRLFEQSWQAARNYGLRDVALNSVERLQEAAQRQNDIGQAYKWSQQLVAYLKDNSPSSSRGGGDAVQRLENKLATVEAENRSLLSQLSQITGMTQQQISEKEAALRQLEQQTQQTLSQKNAELNKSQLEKTQMDSSRRVLSQQVETLSKEQMAEALVRAQLEQEIETKKATLAEAELQQRRSDNQRNVAALLGAFVLVLATLFYFRFRAKKRTAAELIAKNAAIEEERKRSDNLLLNILPPAIAQELKTRNKVAARKYEHATVMFIDFIGFTTVAERFSPETLVEELDFCFSNFDRIVSHYRLEKIKTIGDAYLVASGLSDNNPAPSDMIKAALEIQDFLLHVKAERMDSGLPFFEARIGIHHGPVVAGVVGANKFAYDIWGDTVNIAARMEQSSEPNRVNVSEDVYEQTRYEFEWQSRGKIAAKNKGMMDMYYVLGLKQF